MDGKSHSNADEAGLLYTFNPNTDPNWEEKMDKLQSGELAVKNGQLVPSKLTRIILQ